MFGAVTSLFSGLAFSGLVWTLILQKKELGLQREELRQTRKVFERQAFETTFFNLLESLESYISSLEVSSRKPNDTEYRAKGRRALRIIANECRDLDAGTRMYVTDSAKIEMALIDLYERHFEMYEIELAPYYRSLFNVFRHIRISDLSEEEKFKFGKIVRARLSSPEIYLIVVNGLSSNKDGYTKSISEFGLLRHLPETWASDLPSARATFGEGAYRE